MSMNIQQTDEQKTFIQPQQKSICQLHQQQYLMICIDCNFSLLCLECMTSGFHSRHIIKCLGKNNSHIDIELSQLLVKIKTKIDLFEIGDQRLLIKKNDVYEKYKNIMLSITDNFKQINMELQEKQKQLIICLKNEYEQVLLEIQKQCIKRRQNSYCLLEAHNIIQKAKNKNQLEKCKLYHVNYHNFIKLEKIGTQIENDKINLDLNYDFKVISNSIKQLNCYKKKKFKEQTPSNHQNLTQNSLFESNINNKKIFYVEPRLKRTLFFQQRMTANYKGINSCKESPQKWIMDSFQKKTIYQKSNPSSPIKSTIQRKMCREKTQEIIQILNNQKRNFNKIKR